MIFTNFASSESSYPFYTRNRNFKIPDDIVNKKKYDDSIRIEKSKNIDKSDSLKNIELQLTASIDEGGGLSYDSITFDSSSELSSIEIVQDNRDFQAVQLENINENKRKLAPRDLSNFQQEAPSRLDNALSVSPDTTFQDQAVVSSKVNAKNKPTEFSEVQKTRIDSIIEKNNYRSRSATVALNNARTLKNAFNRKVFEINEVEREYRRYQIAWYQKYTTAFACIVMFMIGAPLGAIIKKGGLGMPVLVSIIFFIIYYMLTITGEKWGKEGMANTLLGTWFSILVLIPIGLFFLKQARKDARLFEQEVYMEALKRVKLWIATKFIKNKKTLLNSK
jgi:lipopolysaccharide export system permease protein